MMEQEKKSGLAVPPAVHSSVLLVIDFSNGVQKSFCDIPWARNMAVLDVLAEACSAGPGLEFVFSRTFTDRGGREVGMVTSINGVAPEADGERWLLWVNRRYIGQHLRTRGNLVRAGEPLVEAGDVITFKLATGP